MIRLDIQEYCGECCDFEPDVKRPEKIWASTCVILTDTVVSCRYAKRCESIKRYLKQKMEDSKNNEEST